MLTERFIQCAMGGQRKEFKKFLEMMTADLSVKGCLRVIQFHITRASSWVAGAREGVHRSKVCHAKEHLLYSVGQQGPVFLSESNA